MKEGFAPVQIHPREKHGSPTWQRVYQPGRHWNTTQWVEIPTSSSPSSELAWCSSSQPKWKRRRAAGTSSLVAGRKLEAQLQSCVKPLVALKLRCGSWSLHIIENAGPWGHLISSVPPLGFARLFRIAPSIPPTASAGQPGCPPSRPEPSRAIERCPRYSGFLVAIALSPASFQPAPSQLPASSQPAPVNPSPAQAPRPAPTNLQPMPQNLWSRRCPTETGLNEWVISNHSPPRKPESGLPGSLGAGEGMLQLRISMPGPLVPGAG